MHFIYFLALFTDPFSYSSVNIVGVKLLKQIAVSRLESQVFNGSIMKYSLHANYAVYKWVFLTWKLMSVDVRRLIGNYFFL